MKPLADGERVPVWFVPAGFAIGFAGTLCGIGGGLFAGPLLYFTRGLPLRRAAATALLLVLATTSASTVTELLRADTLLRGHLVLPLVLGVLGGAQLGFRLSQKLSERGLKAGFCVVLTAAGLRILFSSGAGAPEAVHESGALLTSLYALAVGFGGGFVAPVLGVGGGLLMVPGLFLSIDGLSFNAARATSLAGGMAASLRSVWLHSRAGNIEPRPGLALAGGALFGAAAGVFVTRTEGFVQAGRVLLAAILLAQALRFGRELLRRAQA